MAAQHPHSAADELRRKLQILQAGEPLDVNSLYLPEPWRSQWRPSRRVVIDADGGHHQVRHGNA